MGIIEALNKLGMYLLFDKDLKWEKNDDSSNIFKEETIMVKGNKFLLSLYANKISTNDAYDFYYFDTILKHCDGRVIINNELEVKVPTNNQLINEIFNEEEILAFIEVNAASENQNTKWFASHNYDDSLIDYVENLYSKIESNVRAFHKNF